MTARSDSDEADEAAAWLALSRAATQGTSRWLAAALELGSPRAVVGRSPRELVALGLGRYGGCRPPPEIPSLAEMRAVIADCRRRGIEAAPISSDDYPPLLRTLDDPPLFLFYKGSAPATAQPCVAIVGSRAVSPYGKRVAGDLAARLAAAGFWVVSGMALGTDAAAHRGALSRGRTVAVLAGGLDRASPSSHRELYDAILRTGSALSEHPPGARSYPAHFPIRNRIITGMCPMVIVVEAGLRSGSLVSARLANEQGREVFAVPGNIDSAQAAGTNRLIAEGAVPMLDPREVVAEATRAAARFGQRPPVAIDVATRAASNGGKSHEATVSGSPAGRILAALSNEPTDVDTIARAVGLDQSRVMTLLTALELDGLAERLSVGTFVRSGDLTPR